jgi:L-lactate dehydrogenase complex protein LldG
MDRDAFLAVVAGALRTGRVTDPGPPPGSDLPGEGMDIEAFGDALQAAGGTYHGELRASDAAALAVELALDTGSTAFVTWDEAHLPAPGAVGAIEAVGIAQAQSIVPDDRRERRSHQMSYLPIGFGLTGADALLADTGSVVVRSGCGRPRMASLIPEVHLVLARGRDLFPSLAAWIAASEWDEAGVANWTIITGPSRTADIEQVLTRGVHGPREVHVAVVADDRRA